MKNLRVIFTSEDSFFLSGISLLWQQRGVDNYEKIWSKSKKNFFLSELIRGKTFFSLNDKERHGYIIVAKEGTHLSYYHRPYYIITKKTNPTECFSFECPRANFINSRLSLLNAQLVLVKKLTFTPRQTNILELYTNGISKDRIGKDLGITRKTVETQIYISKKENSIFSDAELIRLFKNDNGMKMRCLLL